MSFPLQNALPFLAALAMQATVLSGAAFLCLLCLRRSPAAARHLICRGLFGALLALPLLRLVMPAWLPESAVPLWSSAISTLQTSSGDYVGGTANWQTMTVFVWIAGLAFVLARISLGFVLLKREARRGNVLTDAEWLADLAAASDRLGLNPHLIRLTLSRLHTPVTFGFSAPVILLPPEAETWTAVSRQAVLLHEMTHIRRRDWLWNCLAQAGLAMFWFHPLVWALYGALRREEELACDDDALLCGIAPVAYAGVLLEMARNLPSRFLLASGMSGKGNAAHLRVRFAHILQKPQSRSGNPRAGKAAIGFLLAVLAGCTSLTNSGSPKVYKIGGDVSMPKLVHRVEPQYSEQARKDKRQGTTVLGITIGADGIPREVHVVRSLRPDLDEKAIAAVEQWRFNPGIRHGAPVTTTANVEVNFKLL